MRAIMTTLNIRLEAQIKKLADQYAKKHRLTLTQVTINAILEYLAKRGWKL